MIGEVKTGNGGQKFEEFKTDPDLENTTISMDDNKDNVPKAMSSDSTADSNQANQTKPPSMLENAKNFVLGRSEPEPQGWLKVFNCLPDEKSYTYAIVAFIFAGVFGMLSFVMLAMIVAAPDKFVLMFTFSMVALIAGFALLKGPRSYIKGMFVDRNLKVSIALCASIIMSLYFAMIEQSYFWSLLCCIIELNAVMYFFCNTGITLNQIKWFCKGAYNAAKSRFK